MVVKIKLLRVGRTKSSLYRIIAYNGSQVGSNTYTKIIGYYNPLKKIFKINFKLTNDLLNHGAQFSSKTGKITLKYIKHKFTSNI